MIKSRKCNKCKKEKNLLDFHKKKGGKFGRNSICKTCNIKQTRKWQTNNKIKLRKIQYKWVKKNPEKVKLSSKKYAENNKDKIKKDQKEYRKNNKQKEKLRHKNWHKNNPEYRKLRRSNNINIRIADSLRSRIRLALKGNQKSGRTLDLLGCSINVLKEHLELNFKPGMTWDNYGRDGWHIDHIKPLSKFDLCDKKQIKLACHYFNLQPLWAIENLRKGNREQ